MSQEYKFTLEAALEAYQGNKLLESTLEYLRSEGWNKGLADNLVEGNSKIIELVEFPLHKLKRIIGPEKTMNYVETPDVWENRITDLVKKIGEGAHFPPLIVTDFWKELEIADGSHRHEALLRSGYKTYWTSFFFKNYESKKLLS